MVNAVCGGCGKRWRVPEAGRRYTCRACGGQVSAEIAAEDFAEAPAPESAPADVAAPAAAPAVTAPEAAPVQAPPPPKKPLRVRSRLVEQIRQSAETSSKARARIASRWLMIMAIIFTIAGVITGIHTSNEAKNVRKLFADRDPNETITLPGLGSMKVSEVLEEVDADVRRVVVIHIVLASAFLGLSFWGRSSPLPAAVTGLCLYLVIQVLNAIVEPTTLVQGIILKTVFIGVMVKAIASAMSERAWRRAHERRGEPEPAATG